jgi:hypothetical protein
MRVVALYSGVQWMPWLLWTGYVLFYGTRVGIILGGNYFFAGEPTKQWKYINFIGLTLSNAESLFYSVESQQCLSGGMKGMSSPATGITTVVAPTVFDIVLLVLTIAKIFKSAALEKHNGSPVVCVTFDCCFFEANIIS